MPTNSNIDKLFDDAKQLFKRKLADYGTQDIVEMGKDDIERMLAVLNRINEKRNRAANILKNGESRVLEEPCRDTFMDIVGYGVIATLLCDGTWEASEGVSDKPEMPRRYESIVRVKETIGTLQIAGAYGAQCPVHEPKMEGDVGYDLEVQKDTMVWPSWARFGKAQLVPCAARIKIPKGMFCQIMGRSSAANKKGLLIQTAVIDENYTGKLFACTFNLSIFPKKVKKGERLAQIVFFRAYVPSVLKVDVLPETARGERGFGSTGK